MPGPAPKDPSQRRRYNQPARSEWIDLPATLEAPVLPAYRRSFTMRRAFWNAWREDPICSQYTAADVAAAVELATQWDALAHSEQRMRATQLGITPQGRRNLRWRTPLEAKQQQEATAKAADVRRLRVINEREEKAS